MWAVVLAGFAYFGRSRLPLRGEAMAAIDLGLVCALTYTSGGSTSLVRFAFYLLPVGAAFLLGPRQTALASALAAALYAAVTLPHPLTRSASDVAFIVAQAGYLLWIGMAATLISTILTRRAARIAALYEGRGRLVTQALAAEDTERRRLAEALHDEPLQNLLAAEQDLAEASSGQEGALDRGREGIRRTVGQLRETAFELHPYLLEQAGLEAALTAVAERQAKRGGFAVSIKVEPEAGRHHDGLLFSLGRELLVNAARHAGASRVDLRVAREREGVRLVVTDDGHGIDPARRSMAVQQGHLGLASSTERVEAVGGTVKVRTAPRAGTTFDIRLPDGGPPPT
ncbi:MAG: sensor histidine kinase [Solirubrobacterales bacterium]